jgi:drug/metabolite transporter (DMT)-like permease
LFFGAVKLGGASIGMIGLSTATLWSALLGPMFSSQKLSWLEVWLGILVVGALAYIFNAEFQHGAGLLLSILAGLVAAIFSFLNGIFVRTVHHHTIALYEMLGAFAFALCVAILNGEMRGQLPSLQDIGYLCILAWACTVYPYSECVALLKRISVFATNLSVNMEPVYGMILAALLLNEHHFLTMKFYAGSVMIIGSVLAYPAVRRYRRGKRT